MVCVETFLCTEIFTFYRDVLVPYMADTRTPELSHLCDYFLFLSEPPRLSD